MVIAEEEEVRQVIKILKRKKAGDHEGWKNELIIAGGYEMVNASCAVYYNIRTLRCANAVGRDDFKINI